MVVIKKWEVEVSDLFTWILRHLDKLEYTERSMDFRPNPEPIRRSVYSAAVAAP